jgi:hypothetical protein
MIIKPDELANLCSIYLTLGTNRITSKELENYAERCMLIDSDVFASEIIEQATNMGLISFKSHNYYLTKFGGQLGKRQGHPDIKISGRAKDFLLKKVYLNIDSGEFCCGNFLMQFHVDTIIGTFVYDRNEMEPTEITQWLKVLNRVGLLDVEKERALVRHDYLEAVNELLGQIRGYFSQKRPDPKNENNKIGEIAEKCAIEYEKRRLEKNGYMDLSMLVQQISIVDKTAGYDILSYKGCGKNPESPIFIEVKGTIKSQIQFIWTKNERYTAQKKKGSYWIYCFTDVNLKNEGAYGPTRIKNPIINLAPLGYYIEPLDVYVCK